MLAISDVCPSFLRSNDGVGEISYVCEAQVEPLPSHGVDTVSSVADQRHSVTHKVVGDSKRQRESKPPCLDPSDDWWFLEALTFERVRNAASKPWNLRSLLQNLVQPGNKDLGTQVLQISAHVYGAAPHDA